jgi:cytochrome P450
MLLDFDEHLMHRRIMQEAFTRPRLKGYLERTDELVAKDVSGWPAEGKMFAYPTLKRLSLDIATHIFMGDSTGEDDAKLQTAFIDTVGDPRRREGPALAQGPGRQAGARGVLHGEAACQAGDRDRGPVLGAVPRPDRLR